MNSLIVPGSTCRLSAAKGATVWEIQTVKPDLRGGWEVYLSKLGGDGFVNKSANVKDLLGLEPQKLDVGLYTVLHLRDEIRRQADSIRDAARFLNHAPKVHDATAQLFQTTEQWRKAVAAYWQGIETHYPHLDTREKK